jgi:hypothetical protein
VHDGVEQQRTCKTTPLPSWIISSELVEHHNSLRHHVVSGVQYLEHLLTGTGYLTMHIPTDTLELYALGRLTEFELEHVEEHLLRCPECVERLNDVEGYARTIRETLRQFTSELIAEHHTEDGIIHVYVRSGSDGTWVGRVKGPQHDGGIAGSSRKEVVAAITDMFHQMFREHRCGPKCMLSNHMRLSG